MDLSELYAAVSFDVEKCKIYLEGKIEPSLEDLIELSQILEVSTDYLLGQIPQVTNIEKKLLNAFVKLNEDNRDIIIGKTKELLREQKYEEAVAADEPLREAK